MACSYCYVGRRKGYANPITTFVNAAEILGAVERHAARQGFKFEPTQADADLWVYELGTNSDLSVDACRLGQRQGRGRALPRPPERQGDLRHEVREPRASGLRPAGKTRLRFSLMPPRPRSSWTCGRRRSSGASRP
jgi:hypothetical protein